MARARNIKPGFFKNEELAECSIWARFIFPGLWMMADREGRLADRAKRIKGELLPYDEKPVEPLLAELEAHGFIVRYEVDGKNYIQIVNFYKHQNPHRRESSSEIPPIPDVGKAQPRHDPEADASHQEHDLGSAQTNIEPAAKHDIGCADTPVSSDAKHALGATQARPRHELAAERHVLSMSFDGTGPADSLFSDSPSLIPDSKEKDYRPTGSSAKPTNDPSSIDLVAESPPKPPAIPCPYERVVELYHARLPTLPKARLTPMPGTRKTALRNRWDWVLSSTKSDGSRRARTAEEAIDWLGEYFAKASENDWLMGRTARTNGHENWRCDLDFLLSDKGLKRVIEHTGVGSLPRAPPFGAHQTAAERRNAVMDELTGRNRTREHRSTEPADIVDIDARDVG